MWRGAWGCLGWLAAPGGEGFLGGSVGLRGCLESGGGLGGWFGCRREGVGELTGVGGGFVALRWWCYGGLSLCKGLAVGVWWSLGWWVWGVVLVGGSGVVGGGWLVAPGWGERALFAELSGEWWRIGSRCWWGAGGGESEVSWRESEGLSVPFARGVTAVCPSREALWWGC